MRHLKWSLARRGPLSVAAALALAGALYGCTTPSVTANPDSTSPPATQATPPEGLDADGLAAWTLWQEQGWNEYSYRLTVGCYCPAFRGAAVVVREGKVVEYKGKSLDPDLDLDVIGFDGRQPTIDALFAVLGNAQADADEVTVEYDGEIGVPTSINVDWISAAIDDEISYSATQVTPSD